MFRFTKKQLLNAVGAAGFAALIAIPSNIRGAEKPVARYAGASAMSNQHMETALQSVPSKFQSDATLDTASVPEVGDGENISEAIPATDSDTQIPEEATEDQNLCIPDTVTTEAATDLIIVPDDAPQSASTFLGFVWAEDGMSAQARYQSEQGEFCLDVPVKFERETETEFIYTASYVDVSGVTHQESQSFPKVVRETATITATPLTDGPVRADTTIPDTVDLTLQFSDEPADEAEVVEDELIVNAELVMEEETQPINIGDATVSLEELEYCMNAPDNIYTTTSATKTYMGYQAVTTITSAQYQLLNSDQCYTNPVTGLRMVGDRYCIALGTGYTSHIGDKVDIVLKNGNIVRCILGDVKSDAHTDEETHTYHVGGWDHDIYYEPDGSVLEFIVDQDVYTGSISQIQDFQGEIQKVVVLPQ